MITPNRKVLSLKESESQEPNTGIAHNINLDSILDIP